MRLLVLSTLAVTSLAACGPAAANGPGAYAADFKTSAAFFTKMSKSVDNSGLDAAKFVHKLQRTWYSANAKEVLGGVVPVGTVAIKETSDAQGAAAAHYVMVKKATDTWSYEVRKPDGTVDAAAPKGDNVATCHGCHTAFKTADYLGGATFTN
jgi:hypothetical protein